MDLSTTTIIVAIIALVLGALAKGISGMGLPLVSTPILTLVFDLQTAIAIVIPATFATDIYMLAKIPKNWTLLKSIVILLIFGAVGIVIGSFILVSVNQLILSGVLGIMILVFVVTSTFKLLPAIKQRNWIDAVIGIIGGLFQGSTGSCGPIISMYLLQMKITRNDFLFIITSFFIMTDIVQLAALYKLGIYNADNYSLCALGNHSGNACACRCPVCAEKNLRSSFSLCCFDCYDFKCSRITV